MTGKKALYLAFEKLMAEKPYPDITISEIVNRAEVNRNTFYYHFKDLVSFMYGYFTEEITNDIKELIKNRKFNEAYILFTDYSVERKEMLKNVFSHHVPMGVLIKIFHEDIRLDVETILHEYEAFLHVELEQDFITFFAHNIIEEYIMCPKQICFDNTNPLLLKRVFHLYSDAIPEKMLKVSKLELENL